MEINQESNDEKLNEEETSKDNAKQWLQDNLRIIISVLIVVLIAGGIYSYSKRTQSPMTSSNSDINSTEITEPTDQTTQSDNETSADKAQVANNEKTAQKEVSSTATSQETQDSFVETAAKGDSLTKLARKSLADYLEKNPDSTLTAEHKIYIEDYLRKNVSSKKVSVGTSVEFSKNLIADAISKSKTLNDKQLQNLHKYALRVPSLS